MDYKEEVLDYFMGEDGQAYSLVKTARPVDLLQMESVINGNEADIAQKQTERQAILDQINALQEGLEQKEAELGEAERKLEASKRGLSAVRALVDGPDDDDEGEGSVRTFANPEPQLV